MENFLSRVKSVQGELKAPKSQRNNFGNYNYRSCEDILEAVKPLLNKYNVVLTISDEITLVGDRYYVKATAQLQDVESAATIFNTAYAREDESKKGMDGSQITGTASSYARKYALNGLFCIDDTKDADTNEFVKAVREKTPREALLDKLKELGIDAKVYAAEKGLSKSTPAARYEELLKELNNAG